MYFTLNSAYSEDPHSEVGSFSGSISVSVSHWIIIPCSPASLVVLPYEMGKIWWFSEH